jgi:putative endonuclease
VSQRQRDEMARCAGFWLIQLTLGSVEFLVPIKSDPETWKDERHRRGLAGEGVAMRFLEARGWRVVSHRFRLGRLEIDVIARKGPVVAFVEVKTRRGSAFGSPLEAVTWLKKREIVRVARGWMDRFGRPEDVYRFDVIGVTLSAAGTRVTHVEDAFRPGWR